MAVMTPALEQLERKAAQAIEEQIEQYALTDATHARSTSRLKTKAERAADRARIKALCEAIHLFSDDRTPFESEQRIADRVLDARAEARDAELDRQEFSDPREQARLQDEADLRFEYSRAEYEDYEPEDDGDDDDDDDV